MRLPGQHQASWAAPDPGTEPALVPRMRPGLRVLCAQRWGGAQFCCPETGKGAGSGEPASPSRWGLPGADRRGPRGHSWAQGSTCPGKEARALASEMEYAEAGPRLRGGAAGSLPSQLDLHWGGGQECGGHCTSVGTQT